MKLYKRIDVDTGKIYVSSDSSNSLIDEQTFIDLCKRCKIKTYRFQNAIKTKTIKEKQYNQLSKFIYIVNSSSLLDNDKRDRAIREHVSYGKISDYIINWISDHQYIILGVIVGIIPFSLALYKLSDQISLSIACLLSSLIFAGSVLGLFFSLDRDIREIEIRKTWKP